MALLTVLDGFRCTKAGGSLGVFDIIGISPFKFVCVQVKSNRKPSREEMETLRQFRVPSNCQKLLHIWHDRQRMPEVIEIL